MSRLGNILKSTVARTVANVSGTSVTLDSYTSSDYTFPSDGYLNAVMGTSGTARASVSIKDANGATIGEMGAASNGDFPSHMLFVKKGMKVRVTGIGNSGHVYFIPVGGGYCLTALSHLVTSVRRWSHEQTWKYIKRYHRKSDRPWNVCGNSAYNRTNNISGEYQHNFNTQHNKVRVLSDRHCRCSVELDRGTNCVVKSNAKLLVECFGWERSYKLFCEKYAHIKNSIHIHILCSLGENLTTISERGCVA